MLKNYLKVAWRNLRRDKTSSLINIGGLTIGMTVAILIGLWIYDELSFNSGFANRERIAQVMQHQTVNGTVWSDKSIPFPIGKELQDHYGENFNYVVMSSWKGDHILTVGEKNLIGSGMYMDTDAPKLFSLHMQKGSAAGFADMHSILLSRSLSKSLFGDIDPTGKLMKIDNKQDVKVAGVYADLPPNNEFRNLDFLAPWNLFVASEPWVKRSQDQWDNNSFQLFVQIAENTNFNSVDKKIKDSKLVHVNQEDKKFHAEIFLHPMSDWHLRNRWDNGIKTGGLIEYVRLFSIIGAFVLILACINFMNLATARSEKRAKEVGIRKAIGSLRSQLIRQFYSESLLVVSLAFVFSILLAQLLLPVFNELASKKMHIPWGNPFFWLTGIAFAGIAGFIAGSYPALYLSSFQPIKVLKGTFRVGRFASLPRKFLVVLQFTISIALVIGTMVVYAQIQYSKNRPIGYNRNGLIMIPMRSPDFQGKFDVLRTALKGNGSVTEFAESSSPLTEIWSSNGGFSWPGKDPNLDADFRTVWVTHEYGKTVGWNFKEGRDFSRDFATDSLAVILNEAAVKFMGIQHPVGTPLKWGSDARAKTFTVIGVIKNQLMESPYEPVRQGLYFMSYNESSWMILKLNPNQSVSSSLAKIETVFKQVIPSAPFDYKFADTEFAAKFSAEEKISSLSTFFAGFAIFISCLGLFGLASFVAEQRTKEIGVRKILGASLFILWRLLSGNFLSLVVFSLCIAIPVAYFFMQQWLKNYPYHTDIPFWIFGITGFGALLITLLTVSGQVIKAALANPVKSLRSE